MAHADDKLECPSDASSYSSTGPELRHKRQWQTRAANSLVERAPQQNKLDPSSQPCRSRQPGSAPLRINLKQMWQRQRKQVSEHGRQDNAHDGKIERSARIVQRIVG